MAAQRTTDKVKQPAKTYRHKCERCGVVVVGEWPCLTATDARTCHHAADAGVRPKLRIKRKACIGLKNPLPRSGFFNLRLRGEND